MGEREHFLFSQKRELLKRRKQLLDIKLQLQKDINVTQPINFGSKYGTISEEKVLSIADGLHHRSSDVRFLDRLECHMLCGLKVVDHNESKLVVQFRPSYLDKILPEVYAICLLAGNNGFSVDKYHLPHLIQMKQVVQRWSPLKQDSLKNFLLDIKQQINAFHHRQNQILQLKEWVNSQNITLKVFHPLSLRYIIITARMNDNQKLRNCRSLNLVLHYDSNCYLPITIDVESSEMEDEELAAAKEQFSAFKLYSLRESFEICFIKTERFSLSAKDDLPIENLNDEDNDSTSVSEENIADMSSTAVSEQLNNFRTLSQVNKESRLLPIVEGARKSKSGSSAKGRQNKNRHNSSTSPEEADISEMSANEASEMMEEARKSISKFSTKEKRKKNRVDSVLQKTKSESTYSTKETRNIASKGQTKKQLKTLCRTDRKASKTKYSPDDAPDGFLHTRKKKSPHNNSRNKVTKEVPTPDQANKITRYLLRTKR